MKKDWEKWRGQTKKKEINVREKAALWKNIERKWALYMKGNQNNTANILKSWNKTTVKNTANGKTGEYKEQYQEMMK